jgi:hypothetical protein
LRLTVYIILLLNCAPAAAAVTCDQLGNIALATEQYRNQGESLQAILAEADKLESGGNLNKEDMVRVRQTVQESYDRTRTPLEIRRDCKEVPGK